MLCLFNSRVSYDLRILRIHPASIRVISTSCSGKTSRSLSSSYKLTLT